MLTVRSGTKHHLLDIGASLPQSLVAAPALDISRKRNLGLLVGRVCGWTRMLFLDDDIRKLHVAKLSSAAALLDDYPVVGLQVKKLPDAYLRGTCPTPGWTKARAIRFWRIAPSQSAAP